MSGQQKMFNIYNNKKKKEYIIKYRQMKEKQQQ